MTITPPFLSHAKRFGAGAAITLAGSAGLFAATAPAAHASDRLSTPTSLTQSVKYPGATAIEYGIKYPGATAIEYGIRVPHITFPHITF